MTDSLQMVKLSEIAELNPTFTDVLEDNDQVSFVPMSAVDAETAGVLDSETRHYAEVNTGYTPFLDGDLLVAKITPCFENGKIAQARLTRRVGFGSTEFHVVRPNAHKTDARYLLHYLRQGHIRREGERKMTGSAGQRRVPEHFLAGLTVPLPPLPEQRMIAEVLDRTEMLRAKRRAAFVRLDFLTQAIFLDMFGDPISNPQKWPQVKLETYFHFRTGKLDSNAAVPGGEFPFFTCSQGDLQIDKYAFDCEALLLAGNNASADYSVKYYKGKFNAYQRTYVITLQDERNSYEYARFVLKHRLSELKRISKGTNTKYLTLELLNRIQIPVPPVQLQNEYARRAAVVEELRIAHRISLGELNTLFASLQYRAFRGVL